jgi:hypothetical protein
MGWKGFVDGEESGVFRVAPLARLVEALYAAERVLELAHDPELTSS